MLPNLVSIITARPVYGERGHGYGKSVFGAQAIHGIKDKYIRSIFDELHKNKMRSTLFGSDNNLGLFVVSYTVSQDALEKTLRKKDPSRFQSYYISNQVDKATLDKFLYELIHMHSSFLFLHLVGPAKVGHASQWDVSYDSSYMREIQKMDQYLGSISKMINKYDHLKRSTFFILTSDHGGDEEDHKLISNKFNFTIPFIVWGPGVAEGEDLYALNKKSRRNPEDRQIHFDSDGQPIRNSDAANLILQILDSPPIDGSAINLGQDLNIYSSGYEYY